mgnify:CR=1 FL=1
MKNETGFEVRCINISKFLTVCSLAALLSSCTAPFVCMAAADTTEMQAVEFDREDGEYSIQVDLEGGSGKASVTSPTLFTVRDGNGYAQIQWSSSNYDYMIVDGEKYEPVNKDETPHLRSRSQSLTQKWK